MPTLCSHSRLCTSSVPVSDGTAAQKPGAVCLRLRTPLAEDAALVVVVVMVMVVAPPGSATESSFLLRSRPLGHQSSWGRAERWVVGPPWSSGRPRSVAVEENIKLLVTVSSTSRCIVGLNGDDSLILPSRGGGLPLDLPLGARLKPRGNKHTSWNFLKDQVTEIKNRNKASRMP